MELNQEFLWSSDWDGEDVGYPHPGRRIIFSGKKIRIIFFI